MFVFDAVIGEDGSLDRNGKHRFNHKDVCDRILLSLLLLCNMNFKVLTNFINCISPKLFTTVTLSY